MSLTFLTGTKGIAAALNNANGHISDSQYTGIVSSDNGLSPELRSFIIAHITARSTHRILLDLQEYEQEKQAIANDVADRVIKTINSALK